MEWTPETVISAIAILCGGGVGGGWIVRWRNGRNGKASHVAACPAPLQKAHGERLARLEAQMETTNATLAKIEHAQTAQGETLATILGRLPK